MRSVKQVIRDYSSQLFSKGQGASLILVSVFLYSGLFLSLYLSRNLPSFSFQTVTEPCLSMKLIAIYFALTLIFALGLSQAGFAVIPLLVSIIGFCVSFLLCRAVNDGARTLLFDALPFAVLVMAGVTIYGAAQIRYSWQLFYRDKDLESLSALQDNIKLYYFTLAVFTLLTAVSAGFGYIISFVYRSLL